MASEGGATGSGRSGCVKAAALLERLGMQKASEVVKRLSPSEVERLGASFAKMREMPGPERRELAEEALGELLEGSGGEGDRLRFARELLSEHLGDEGASRALGEKSGERLSGTSLEWMPDSAAERLVGALGQESPRIVATILSALRSSLAARLLALLPAEVSGASLLCLADRGNPRPEAVGCLLARVGEMMSGAGNTGDGEGGPVRSSGAGHEKVVEILRRCDRPTEQALLEHVEQQSPELAQRVSQSIFSTMADLKWLDKRSLQAVLREVEVNDLSRALRGAPEEVLQLCLENLSENAAASLKEEIDSLGPTPRRDVEAAQQTMMGIVRTMIAEERIQVVAEEEDLI